MAVRKPRAIVAGDRFISTDARDEGRVIEVIQELGINDAGAQRIRELRKQSKRANNPDPEDEGPIPDNKDFDYDKQIEAVRQRRTFFRARTEAHPNNPSAIGTVVRISEHSIRTDYKRQTR